MVQTKTLGWFMVIALAVVTFVFFNAYFDLGEIHKMLEDSSFFIIRSIIILCFFLFFYYTSKLLYRLFSLKKPTENVFIGTLFLLFFFSSLKPLLIEILFGYNLSYCYYLDMGNCIEAIIMPIVSLFALSLILLSSLFYLGLLQANKKVAFIPLKKEKIAKMQIAVGGLLFVGTFIWSLFILPSSDHNTSIAFNDYMNDMIEVALSENPHTEDTLTKEDITQGMLSYTFDTVLFSTKWILSVISVILLSISLFFILQGFYNLTNTEKQK